MSEQAETRKMRILELLAESGDGSEIETLAERMRCDTRTIRRDLESLQRILQQVQGLEVRRGRAAITRAGYSPGYFTNQLGRNASAKEAIAAAIVGALPDDLAVALTAGSTTYAVAREIRRAVIAGEPPHNLIVFTNSVPSLLELVSGGVSAGVLGEIYTPEDCALHSPEFRSAFQPGVAIVGASGILFGSGASAGMLDLFSHRAEEAAFHKQLLADIPEIILAADSAKIGKRHPWNFGGTILRGKSVRLVTDTLTAAQRQELERNTVELARNGITFTFETAEKDDNERGETQE